MNRRSNMKILVVDDHEEMQAFLQDILSEQGYHTEAAGTADEALNLTKALVARGYSQKDIEKIWGGNFLRVFRRVEQS